MTKGEFIKPPFHWSTDGKEVPAPGVGNSATTIAKVQGHTGDSTLKIEGKIVETVHTVVSPDGRTQRSIIDAKDEQGRSVHNVVILEKQ